MYSLLKSSVLPNKLGYIGDMLEVEHLWKKLGQKEWKPFYVVVFYYNNITKTSKTLHVTITFKSNPSCRSSVACRQLRKPTTSAVICGLLLAFKFVGLKNFSPHPECSDFYKAVSNAINCCLETSLI